MAERWSNKRLTKEEWVAKARSIWGDAYDYSESIYLAGMKPITIRCIKHNHYFSLKAAGSHVCTSKKKNGHRVLPSGCPICSKERRLARELQHKQKSKEQKTSKAPVDWRQRFIDKAKAIYGDKYDYSQVVYRGAEKRVTIICPDHGPFDITPDVMLNGARGCKRHGCPDCDGIRKPNMVTSESFREEMKRIYGNKYDFSKSIYIGKKKCIEFICPHHGKQSRYPDTLLKGSGCRYCNGELLWPADFPRLAREIHGDKYEYPELPKNRTSTVTIICKEHGPFHQQVDLHLRGCGCPKCSNPCHWSLEERKENFINKSKERYGDRFDYSLVEYVDKKTFVKIRCKEHDYVFETTPDNHIRRNSGCPICNDSTGEVEIRLWLDKHKILYEIQHPIPNENPECRRSHLRVDFYLPEHNAFVEFHGQQHFEDIPHFYLTKDWTFKDQQIRDQTLRDYCAKYNIHLIEIRYDQMNDIGKILKRELRKFKRSNR